MNHAPGRGAQVDREAGNGVDTMSVHLRVHVPACPADRSTCRQTECRHHMSRLARARVGAETLHPCALIVAEHGPHTLDEVGRQLGGLSRERVRQIEAIALASYRQNAALLGLEPMDERRETLWERTEREAPGGGWVMDLRGSRKNWKRCTGGTDE